MKKYCLIHVFIGKPSSLFFIWLESCKCNPLINFLLITDIPGVKSEGNIKVIHFSWEELKRFIQKKYDFQVRLRTPYRLCNFKPAYGDIFSEYLQGYDYWGYCDSDLIFGDLQKFLSVYDNDEKIIGEFGHCTLIKNSEEMNKLYRYREAYKLAFSQDYNMLYFDEQGFKDICKINKIPIKPIEKLADFNPRRKAFIFNKDCRTTPPQPRYAQIFTCEGHHLFRYFINETELLKEEMSYIHFLKRKMKITVKNKDSNLLIIPGNIVELDNKKICEANILSWNNEIPVLWYVLKIMPPLVLFRKIIYNMVTKNKERRVRQQIRQILNFTS